MNERDVFEVDGGWWFEGLFNPQGPYESEQEANRARESYWDVLGDQ
jgi:hypothetical protein